MSRDNNNVNKYEHIINVIKIILCVIGTSIISNTYCFLIKESYNINFEDTGEYKVDDFLVENDYEMIKDNDLRNFKIDNKENKLYLLNVLAHKEYDKNYKTKTPPREWFRKTEPTISAVTDNVVELLTVYKENPGVLRQKRNGSNSVTHPDSDYNYEYLINEYYGETLEEVKSNNTFDVKGNVGSGGVISSIGKILKFDTRARNCTEEEIKHIGFKAVNCIWQDYKNHKQPPKVLVMRLWRIIKIWFIVYLVIAIPLFCTRGWCCCCLFCKFFKPKRTIENAKRYLVKNPPGVLRPKKGSELHYEPTEYEIESYENFEHIIRII